MTTPFSSRQEHALAEIGKSEGWDDPPTEALIKCLTEDPELATCVDQNGYTLLHHAVRITRSADVLKLLANGSSLTAQNKWKRTALHQACGFGSPAHVVSFLADRSAQALDLPDEYGLVPLHYACWKGMEEAVIARLVDARPGAVRATSADGETPLFSACECESRLPTSVYARLLREWPIAAAIIHATDDGRRWIPLKRVMVLPNFDPSVVKLLLTHSVHVLIGLVQSVLHESSSVPDATTKFLRSTLLRFHPDLGRGLAEGNSPIALSGSLQSVLLNRNTSPSSAKTAAALLPLLEAVFHDPSMQAIVKDSQHQAMICCLSKIGITAPSLLDRCGFVSSIFESASDNLDCLYVCLRETPDLFLRRQTR